MNIQKIQTTNTSFTSKRKVTESLRKGMANLKVQMEYDSVMSKYNEPYTKTVVRGVKINDEAVFKDGKFLAKRNAKKQLIPYGNDTSMIEFDDIRLITRDNGEVIECKKPLFKSWASVFKKAENYINYALKNYSDPKTIQKQTKIQVKTNPQEKFKIILAYQKLMETFNKINPWK